jgi:drug/metabolite transporter (DMT)-like permease
MFDATKSPVPPWKRYAVVALLAIFIAVAGYVVWSKELRHASPSSSPTAPPANVVAPARVQQKAATATTIPGGIPISSRNPFASS